MRTVSMEKWAWILIYGGLLAVAIGLAVRGASAWLTPLLVVVGALAVVAGGVLIWLRSRRPVQALPSSSPSTTSSTSRKDEAA